MGIQDYPHSSSIYFSLRSLDLSLVIIYLCFNCLI